MKITAFIVIALIMILALLTTAATGDRDNKITNTLAITVAACIITLLYVINS